MKTSLQPFNVTIRVFDPQLGPEQSGEEYVLPVDSPDQDHAIASTMANAVSFTPKTEGGKPRRVAFLCTAVAPRS